MKQKVIFIVGIFLFVFLAVAVIRILLFTTPKQGELRIESQPLASIYVDNKSVGKTPITKTPLRIESGEHTIKVTSDATPSLAGWESTVRIVPGTLTSIRVALSESELTNQSDMLWMERISANKTELVIQSDPEGAIVMIDQDMKGVTPLTVTDISEGIHDIFVSARGYLPRTVTAKITKGYRVYAQFQLALSPGSIDTQENTTQATPSAQVTSSTLTPSPTVTKITPTPSKEAVITTRPDPETPYAVVKETPTGFLRLRMEPSTTATEVAKLKPGEKYSILKEKDGWFELEYSTSTNGWASGQYLDKVE